MSYLIVPRLTFSGQFQADPSTVNNDPTHFNNETFEPKYQNYGPGQENGWWNPDGTGNWRFLGCKITSVTYQDGSFSCQHQEQKQTYRYKQRSTRVHFVKQIEELLPQ